MRRIARWPQWRLRPERTGWFIDATLLSADPSPPKSGPAPEGAGRNRRNARIREPAGDLADRTQEDTVRRSGGGGPRRGSGWRDSAYPAVTLAAVAGAVVVALVAGGVTAGWMRGWWGDSAAPAPSGTPTPGGAETASPFAGTPAEHFAEGEAGIVLPAAEPVGDFTAEEVAEALEQVRQALIAARLDETMLVDHNPEKFLSLLAPDHQVGRRLEFDNGEFASYATQIAPGVELAPVPPRVHGTITYEATTVEGGLPATGILPLCLGHTPFIAEAP